MRSRTAFLPLFLLVASIATAQMKAQTPFPAQIGNSVVALTGPWKFHPGDDMAWAQPDYDDSAWASMDLTPPPGSIDPGFGSSGYVPGWTTRGYPKLTRFAWYRLRVNIRNDASGAGQPDIALKMPEDVDNAYQIYVKGQLIGGFGRFGTGGVTIFSTQPRAFAWPSAAGAGAVTIAIRMWMDPATPYQTPDAGGMHGPPMLGTAPAIDAMLRLDWGDVTRALLVVFARASFVLLMSLLGFTLFWFDRRELAYLWLGLACFFILALNCAVIVGIFTTNFGLTFENIFIDVILIPIQFGAWVIFWGYWFGFTGMKWIHRIAWSLVVMTSLVTLMMRPPLFSAVVPVAAEAWLFPLIVGFKILLGLLVFWIAWRGIRASGGDGWMALPALLIMPIWFYYDELSLLHFPWILHIFGLVTSIGQIATFLTLAVVSVLMLRRFLRGLRQKQQLETEMEQARQVQQVLIPEALPSIPGLAIESEYRPAQQVGGDFFQVLTTEDGGVVAVIGDVSGKGMPAALTVALLVGTIRTEAHHTNSPAKLLAMMNTRLLRRSQGGFTTCLTVRVDADGKVTAANAGHLPPYLNGREISVANNLPLGLSTGAEYGEASFQLKAGDRLTLLTDGVVEARNAAGELFGFERAAGMAREPAAAIAEAAQQHGQEDDITVLTLTWVAKEETAPPKAEMVPEPA
jgi:hypothetical protein